MLYFKDPFDDFEASEIFSDNIIFVSGHQIFFNVAVVLKSELISGLAQIFCQGSLIFLGIL